MSSFFADESKGFSPSLFRIRTFGKFVIRTGRGNFNKRNLISKIWRPFFYYASSAFCVQKKFHFLKLQNSKEVRGNSTMFSTTNRTKKMVIKKTFSIFFCIYDFVVVGKLFEGNIGDVSDLKKMMFSYCYLLLGSSKLFGMFQGKR